MPMIVGITTTRDAGGRSTSRRWAWSGWERLVSPSSRPRPFAMSRRRLCRVQLGDDVLLAQAAIESPLPWPADKVAGVVLEAACSWYELEVEPSTPPRPFPHRCAVVHRGRGGVHRVQPGEARGARAAILATRVHIPRGTDKGGAGPSRGAGGRPPVEGGRPGSFAPVRGLTALEGREGMSLPVERVRFAPARLHFGVLDLRGMLGRRFGGMAPVPAPALQLGQSGQTTISPLARTPSGRCRSPDGMASSGTPGGPASALPTPCRCTVGLVGTQLALSVARALAELYGQPSDAATLARLVVAAPAPGWAPGCSPGWVRARGGRREGADGAAPGCRCPHHGGVSSRYRPGPGLSGEARPRPSAHSQLHRNVVEHIAHLVLMTVTRTR